MKTLKFTDSLQYDLLYESCVGRVRGYDIQQARIAGKILDKLETIGKVSEVTRTGLTLFTIMHLPNQVELEDAEFDLLSSVFREMAWSGTGARKAVAVDDWLQETARG